ncbi:MAG: phosphoribosylglycinamide formyltransferase [Chitinophagaceae bacterium]
MKRIAIFASGAGTNAENIIQASVRVNRDGGKKASYEVALIVCNNSKAGVLNIAGNYNIPVFLIKKERFYQDAYLPELQKAGIDFIVLAGFLWKIPQLLINAFPHRIVNIHPALLPKYGGKEMYGKNVHAAVLHNNETVSGITIHYVDEHYDNGDIIFQKECEVKEDDTPETLAKRIHELEYKYYPRIIENALQSFYF